MNCAIIFELARLIREKEQAVEQVKKLKRIKISELSYASVNVYNIEGLFPSNLHLSVGHEVELFRKMLIEFLEPRIEEIEAFLQSPHEAPLKIPSAAPHEAP